MAHMVRSVGNSVGLPAMRNTNRTTAKYTKKANRKARRLGFNDAVHRAVFTALMAERITAAQEAQNGN